MKTLILFTLLAPSIVFARTEILESGAAGFSHIDPLGNQAYITVKTDLKNGKPRYKVSCAIDKKTSKPIKNYFVFKKRDAAGIFRNEKLVRPGYSCDQIEAEEKAAANGVDVVEGCQAFAATEVIVAEPESDKCGTDPNFEKCEYSDTATEQLVKVNLSADTVVKARDMCGGDANPLMIVRDTVSPHAIFSNLSGETACKLDKRRIFMDGSGWDGCINKPECKYQVQESSPYVHLYTSKDPGFNIGAMRNPSNPSAPDSVFNFNYDFEKKSWCQHILPDYGDKSGPTCDPAYAHKTFPMSFPTPNKVYKKGVVQLGMEGPNKDIPVAYIGSPKPGEGNVLDDTKALIKVTLMKNSATGAMTVFESKPNLAGATIRTLTVAPNYTVGSRFTAALAANSCDKGMCLRAPSQFVGSAEANSGLSCSNNGEPLDITDKGSADLCYSCNGVTPGQCGPPRENTGNKDSLGNDIYKPLRTMIGKDSKPDAGVLGASDALTRLNQCRGNSNLPPTDDSITPTAE